MSRYANGILEIDNDQIFVQSTVDEFTASSAQAFMQGLYPPVDNERDSLILNAEYLLANGSNVQYPLGGFQYANVYTASPLDPNSIWLSGADNCPAYLNSSLEYFTSSEYTRTASATQDFYAGFDSSIFAGELEESQVNFHDAYYIFDYLSYGSIHNSTIQARLSNDDLFQARTLADDAEFALYGNISADGGVRTIGGQTLAAYVLGLLINNIENNGQTNKLNLLFTSFEPMISLAALLGLPNMYTQFFGIPELGSSMVFEMFSIDNDTSGTYPDPSDLYVRFLFRNGTNSTTNLGLYPVFGRGHDSSSMNLSDFIVSMESIMLSDVGEWCTICSSLSVFCAAFANDAFTNTTGNTTSSLPKKSSPATHPAIAGVIGALIALVLAATTLAAVMFFLGIRFYRRKSKRRSELGGFKGAEKLASDQDLSILKGSGVGATVTGKGHERIGSWELGEASKAKEAGMQNMDMSNHRNSFDGEGDRISIIEQHLEPVRVEERV